MLSLPRLIDTETEAGRDLETSLSFTARSLTGLGPDARQASSEPRILAIVPYVDSLVLTVFWDSELFRFENGNVAHMPLECLVWDLEQHPAITQASISASGVRNAHTRG